MYGFLVDNETLYARLEYDNGLERRKEEQQREQLRLVGNRFLAGEYISSEDFIGLCKLKLISIPLRTHGTLSRSVIELSRDSICPVSYTHLTLPTICSV